MNVENTWSVLGAAILGVCLAYCASAAAAAAAASGGEALAWKYHCVTCHGENGQSTQSRFPNIAGQNALYLESRLKYFRSGIEPANRMNGHAAPLSDEEISVLSQHFSRLPQARGDEPGTGATLVNEKGCVACHGPRGVAAAPIYPHLAGQWTTYLRKQLVAYRAGKRQNLIMNGFAKDLSDTEIRALAEFYGAR